MSTQPADTQTFIVEFVEHGYKRILFSVEAQDEQEAEEKIEAYEPEFNEVPGVEIIKSDFNVTDAEIVSIDPVRNSTDSPPDAIQWT